MWDDAIVSLTQEKSFGNHLRRSSSRYSCAGPPKMPASHTTGRVEKPARHCLRPRIVLGVTSPQTCVVLRARACALRDAGFDVTLLSAPGELLEQTARSEHVEACAIPM